MKKITIIGSSCAGKTTLGRELSQNTQLPFTDLDDLNWNPGWIESPLEEFRDKVQKVVAEPSWIIAGNYGKVRDLIWPHTEIIIWLDYSFPLVLNRSLRRTIRRAMTGEVVCNGNKESLYQSFCTKDSIIWWVITTFKRRRAQYEELFAHPDNAHIKVSRFRSPRQLKKWLKLHQLSGVIN